MDLLAPCRMCLQCLPVFSSTSPPSSPRPSPAHATSEKDTNIGASAFAKSLSENDLQEGDKPSFSDASLSHDHQHQGLPLSEHAKELRSPIFPPADSKLATKGGENHSCPDTSQQVNQQVFENTLPFNDIEFSTSGLMPLPPPISPTPIGLGYIVGQHPPSQHIHDQVNSGQNEGHSFLHHSHSHDKAPPVLPSSHSAQDKQHTHTPLPSSQFKGDGGEAHTHHQHSDNNRDNDIQDDSDYAPPSESSQYVHGNHLHVDHLETTHSTPDIELASAAHDEQDIVDKDTAKNGSSSTLETSQSEPIEGVGSGRVKRRDQFKHQLKDLRKQLKQGGLHLKEEGSKHLQNMVSNMNKQAQRIEESGSRSMTPRS